MKSNFSELINNLKKSKLVAECPNCLEEFSLASITMFDGTKKFPEMAESRRLEWQKEFDDRFAELKERQIRADSGAEKKAIAIGIGKIIEKVIPAYKNFNMVSSDCRFLAEPIDMIVFDGVSELNIKHITFMDIKTGNAKLNHHQKLVRDAVVDHNVRWEVI